MAVASRVHTLAQRFVVSELSQDFNTIVAHGSESLSVLQMASSATFCKRLLMLAFA